MESRAGPGMERHRADHISAVAIAERRKTQTPKRHYAQRCLIIGTWGFFGTWSLGFGIFVDVDLNVENGGCR